LNSQWPVTESAQIQTERAMRQHRTKRRGNNKSNSKKQRQMNQAFTLKHELLKKIIYILETAFAAETRLA
jgi:hypothetical protein